MRRALLCVLLLGLVVPFSFIPSGSSLPTPTPDTWTRQLDPLAETAVEYVATFDTSGNYGLLYEVGGVIKFGYSSAGSATFTKVGVDGAITGLNHPGLAFGDGVWYAVFESDAGSWYLYTSTDAGATWVQRQTTVAAISSVSVATFGSRVGIVVTEDAGNLKWYRSSDAGVTFDKTATLDASTTWLGSALLSWDSSKLDVYYSRAGGAVERRSSEDAGAFWASAVTMNSPSGTYFDGFTGAVSPDKSWGAILKTGSSAYLYRMSGWGGAGFTISNTLGAYSGTGCTGVGGLATVDVHPNALAIAGGTLYADYCGNGARKLITAPQTGSFVWTDDIGSSLLDDTQGSTPRALASWEGGLAAAIRNQGVGSRFEVHQIGAVTALGPAQSIAVTGLTGFDVDVTGRNAVARLTGGTTVKAYDAITLQPSATTITANCNRIGGVTTSATHVALLHCDAGDPGDVDGLWIRSSSLGTPTATGFCTGATFCTYELTDNQLAGPQDAQLSLSDVESYPLDYTAGGTSGNDYVNMAFAYTTNDGNAGLMTYTWVNNELDASFSTQALVDATGAAVDLLCFTRDGVFGNGGNYLYTGTGSTNVKAYQAVFQYETHTFGVTTKHLHPFLNPVFSGVTATKNPSGLGCGEGAFTVASGDVLTVWNCRVCSGQAATHTITLPSSAKSNGVAMSDDGKWIAVAVTDQVLVYNAISGAVATTLSLPSGTFRDVEIQGAGTHVWVAMDTSINVYEVFTETVGADVPYDPDAALIDETTDEEEQAAEGFFGDSLNSASAATGISVDGLGLFGQAFLSSFLVGMMAVPVYVGTKSAKLTMAVGALVLILSLVVGWQLGLLSGAILTTIIFLGIVATVLAVIFGRR